LHEILGTDIRGGGQRGKAGLRRQRSHVKERGGAPVLFSAASRRSEFTVDRKEERKTKLRLKRECGKRELTGENGTQPKRKKDLYPHFSTPMGVTGLIAQKGSEEVVEEREKLNWNEFRTRFAFK